MERTVVGIDVGTTKVCALVGEVSEEGILRIVGVGVAPSRGMRKGGVVNVHEVMEAIATAVDQAERVSGYQITRVYVRVAGDHIVSTNTRGMVAIPHGDRGIGEEDVQRVLEAAQTVAVPQNREVLHVIPRGYCVDGQDGVRDPRGLYGVRLEVEAHVVTGVVSAIQNLVRCVEELDIGVDGLVLDPLAAGEAVLTDTEREMGVVLADIGGGTTDVAIFIEGSVWHTKILPIGGHHVTNDIAIGLRVPFTVAEDLKKRYGYARADAVGEDELLEVSSFGDGQPQVVPRRFLAEIIEARMEEIFQMVMQEVKRSGYDGLLPAGVVLCGGTAELAGVVGLGRRVFGLPVRVGAPADLQGLVDELHRPAYATSVGLLLWAMKEDGGYGKVRSRRPGLGTQLGRWLRRLLPG